MSDMVQKLDQERHITDGTLPRCNYLWFLENSIGSVKVIEKIGNRVLKVEVVRPHTNTVQIWEWVADLKGDFLLEKRGEWPYERANALD